MEMDGIEDEEKELLEDDLRLLQKVDSIASLASLHETNKPFPFFHPFMQASGDADGLTNPDL